MADILFGIGAIDFRSDVEDKVKAFDIEAAQANLMNSATFAQKIADIEAAQQQTGKGVLVRIVDGNNPKYVGGGVAGHFDPAHPDVYAKTQPLPNDPNYSSVVTITIQFLQKATYKDVSGGEHPYTLQRILAHEVGGHAHQFAVGSTAPDLEAEADQVETSVMIEISNAPIKVGIAEIGREGTADTQIYIDVGNGAEPIQGTGIQDCPQTKPKSTRIEKTEADQEVDGATISPLVLDLDGTGINLTALDSDDSVYWRFDPSSNFAQASAWIDQGTGLLALDTNLNGIIDDQSELFGGGTEDGFNALAVYDSNADGVINAADAVWNDLLVWEDIDGDAFSSINELFSMDDLNISEISLGYTLVNYEISGNQITHESTYTINGQSRDIVDVYPVRSSWTN